MLKETYLFFVELFLLGTRSLSLSLNLPQSPWYIGFPLDLVSLLSPLSSPVFSPTLAHSLSPSAKPPRLDGFVKRISFDL